jgi:hypothetical protein
LGKTQLSVLAQISWLKEAVGYKVDKLSNLNGTQTFFGFCDKSDNGLLKISMF